MPLLRCLLQVSGENTNLISTQLLYQTGLRPSYRGQVKQTLLQCLNVPKTLLDTVRFITGVQFFPKSVVLYRTFLFCAYHFSTSFFLISRFIISISNSCTDQLLPMIIKPFKALFPNLEKIISVEKFFSEVKEPLRRIQEELALRR